MIALLALAFCRTSGVFWFGDACGENCSDDRGDGKQCPPGCPSCDCAPTTQTVPATRITVVTPVRDVQSVTFVALLQFVPAPDPRDILHVPKLAA